jgi:hypothetical protein
MVHASLLSWPALPAFELLVYCIAPVTHVQSLHEELESADDDVVEEALDMSLPMSEEFFEATSRLHSAGYWRLVSMC